MKIGYNWLSQYIDIQMPIDKIGEILTDIGLEVEGIEKMGGSQTDFSKVLVGEVVSCSQHPNADKLKCCKVHVGAEEQLSIVCGAPNVAEGQKVMVAVHGAVLMPTGAEKPFKIKKGKIRGEASQGMICALDELGFGNDHSGIHILDSDAIIGDSVKAYLDIEEDATIEIGLTPNRADAMSHLGVARDLKAYCELHQIPYTWKAEHLEPIQNELEKYPIEVQSDKCFRYAGLVVKNVQVAPSPEWLVKALASIGINTTNNLVDISNYIMHHIGQPLHFFDADKIAGDKIIVRQAKAGEKLLTLDEREIELVEEDLVICDKQDAMCIAGVMGGIHSSVSDSTSSIFIESAYFEPVSVRKSAKRHTFHTDASFRFERGIDFKTTLDGVSWAVELIQEVCPDAEVINNLEDIVTKEVNDFQFEFSLDYCRKIIGKNLETAQILAALKALDIQVIKKTEDLYELSVPSYRNDVTRPIDVVEDVLRLVGYNSIELPSRFQVSLEIENGVDEHKLYNDIANSLVAVGYHEAMNNSLTKQSYKGLMDEYKAEQAVDILNPLSQDLGILRQSMLMPLLENIAYNFNHKNDSIKLFEFGKTYAQYNGNYAESKILAFALSGHYRTQSWNEDKEKTQFFQLKSAIELVLAKAGLAGQLKQKELKHSAALDGIVLKHKKTNIASIMIVNPKVAKACGLKKEAFYGEIYWDNLVKIIDGKVEYEAVSKYPSVKRDLALVMDEKISFGEIKSLAFEVEKNILTEVEIFDVYRGEKLETGKKSYAISFTFLDKNKTLVDKVVDKAILKIYSQLQKKFGLELRDGELKA